MEPKCKGIIFWAHPDYRREGPWHDWAYFQFSKDGTTYHLDDIPSEIQYFVDLKEPILVTQQGVEGEVDLRTFLDGWIDNEEGCQVYAVAAPMAAKPKPLRVCSNPKRGNQDDHEKQSTSLLLKCG